MKPICELALENVLRSMRGVRGSPCNFSWSPYLRIEIKCCPTCLFYHLYAKNLSTWLKNSRRRQSSHTSDTLNGLHSFEISDTFMRIFINYDKKKLFLIFLNEKFFS